MPAQFPLSAPTFAFCPRRSRFLPLPAIPVLPRRARFPPRHSRESGNPEGWERRLSAAHPTKFRISTAASVNVNAPRWVDGKTTVHKRRFIPSLPTRADRILSAVRERWKVENGIHRTPARRSGRTGARSESDTRRSGRERPGIWSVRERYSDSLNNKTRLPRCPKRAPTSQNARIGLLSLSRRPKTDGRRTANTSLTREG